MDSLDTCFPHCLHLSVLFLFCEIRTAVRDVLVKFAPFESRPFAPITLTNNREGIFRQCLIENKLSHPTERQGLSSESHLFFLSLSCTSSSFSLAPIASALLSSRLVRFCNLFLGCCRCCCIHQSQIRDYNRYDVSWGCHQPHIILLIGLVIALCHHVILFI